METTVQENRHDIYSSLVVENVLLFLQLLGVFHQTHAHELSDHLPPGSLGVAEQSQHGFHNIWNCKARREHSGIMGRIKTTSEWNKQEVQVYHQSVGAPHKVYAAPPPPPRSRLVFSPLWHQEKMSCIFFFFYHLTNRWKYGRRERKKNRPIFAVSLCHFPHGANVFPEQQLNKGLVVFRCHWEESVHYILGEGDQFLRDGEKPEKRWFSISPSNSWMKSFPARLTVPCTQLRQDHSGFCWKH